MLDIKKRSIFYGLFALICIIVNYIYSLFSHNVSSIYMTYMFVIPIVGYLFSLISNKYLYNNLLASSILTITLASFLEGIIEIAGTDTIFVYILLGVSIILFISSLFFIKKAN